MGDIAEAMLNGILCQVCGEWTGRTKPLGYPVTCGGCTDDQIQESLSRENEFFRDYASRNLSTESDNE